MFTFKVTTNSKQIANKMSNNGPIKLDPFMIKRVKAKNEEVQGKLSELQKALLDRHFLNHTIDNLTTQLLEGNKELGNLQTEIREIYGDGQIELQNGVFIPDGFSWEEDPKVKPMSSKKSTTGKRRSKKKADPVEAEIDVEKK